MIPGEVGNRLHGPEFYGSNFTYIDPVVLLRVLTINDEPENFTTMRA